MIDTTKTISKVTVDNVEVPLAGSSGDDKFKQMVDGSLTTMTADDFEGVTSIRDYAFEYQPSLISVEIPDTVTDIGNYSFRNCFSLTYITIPEGVSNIPNGFLQGCWSLLEFTIPNSVTVIGASSFSSCYSLTQLTIPAGVTSIELSNLNYALAIIYNNSELEISPGDMFGFGAYAREVITPLTPQEERGSIVTDSQVQYYVNALETIKVALAPAVGRNVLTSVTLASDTTEINQRAFYHCESLVSIDFGNSQVETIGVYAFNNCSLLSLITIPNTITTLPIGLFSECASLTNIIIPSSITAISNMAFNNCSSLATMRVEAITPPTLGGNSLNGTALTQIQVPMASVDAYKTATNWTRFADIIVGYTE